MSSEGLVTDLIYDVGVHRGEDTAYYMARGFRVVGFEANPDLVDHCQRRFHDEIASGQLRLIAGAIDESGGDYVTFYRHPHNSEWGTTDASWAARNVVLGESQTVEVPTVRLASVMQETGVPHFVKIDIEGADLICLREMASSEVKPAYVSLESSKTDFRALLEEFALLENLGYNRFAVVQQAGIKGTEIATTRIDGTPMTYRFEPDSSGAFGADVGPWLDRHDAIARYRQVFRQYRLLGDASVVRRTRLGRGLRGQLARQLGRPLPGWYDTHAKRVEP